MQIIYSSDNQYLKAARKLKQRKYREQESRFLMEGRVPIAELMGRQPERIAMLFITEDQSEWLKGLAPNTIPVLILDEKNLSGL